MIGQTLDRYKIESKLGEGGMGVVYKARDTPRPQRHGEPVKILDNVLPLSLDVVDAGVYYLERVAGEGRLRYFDFTGRKSTVVASNLGNVFSGLTASRAGRVILYTRVDSSIDDLMLVENFR